MNENRPILWTSDQALQATHGTCEGAWQARGVSIDSRTLEPEDLFVAIAGPVHDGHRFVGNAFAAGASAAVVQSSRLSDADRSQFKGKLLVVEDAMQALVDLAEAARQRTSARIVAVTGSVGKTGTKEMLKLVLSDQGGTMATVGNLNNHYGLPLSLARLPQEAQFGVFELGMSSTGEILQLTRMARPHVAVITAIEAAHSEFFNSIEEIADAKAEIFAGLEPAGVAVLNGDNPMFDRLARRANEAGITDVRVFGSGAGADCRLVSVENVFGRSRVSAELRGTPLEFDIAVPGRHWVQNALAVLCTVDALGADPVAAASKLAEMKGLKGRGQHHRLSISGGTFLLVDESYNASPASMKAAIEVLGQSTTEERGRKIAVLGDMLELGTMSDVLHAGLVDDLNEQGIDLVFTTGQYMTSLWDELPTAMRGGHCNMARSLSPLLRSVIRPGDIVMVKGSHGSHTGIIVEDLLKLGQAPDMKAAPSLLASGK